MIKTFTPPYTSKIIAFVDILGFKEMVYSLPKNSILHDKVYQALCELKHRTQLSRDEKSSFYNLEVTTFSDSIVISSEDDNAASVIYACGWIQAELFKLEILTRGGVSSGLTIHKDGILYGEGFLKAHDLENKCATYPRILIDSILVSTFNQKIKTFFLSEDVDGLWFIDPFKFDAFTHIGDDAIADGYDPREIYFYELLQCVDKGIKEAKNDGIMAKWKWLKNKAQTASKQYLETRESNFSKTLKSTK
jgi:hypothetical protein